MTPEEFDEVLANLSAGFYADADTLRRFVEEAVRLTGEVKRLQAELDELKAENAKLLGGMDRLGKVWEQ
jgi:hypothetical protein